MALIKCIECGNAISDTAVTCPKCGISLQQERNVVTKQTTNDAMSGTKKLFNILSIIFISLYSISCICTLYTNLKTYFEYYIDNSTFADICYYLNVIVYNIGSPLLLWMLLINNINNDKKFKIASGIILIVIIISTLIYYIAGTIEWATSVESFIELLKSVFQNFFGYYGILISLYLLNINKK